MDLSGLNQNFQAFYVFDKRIPFITGFLRRRSLSFFVFLALTLVLARTRRPQVLDLRGGFVPLDFILRTVRSGSVLYCVRRRQYMKTVYVDIGT